jgi:hypothetical protein
MDTEDFDINDADLMKVLEETDAPSDLKKAEKKLDDEDKY